MKSKSILFLNMFLSLRLNVTFYIAIHITEISENYIQWCIYYAMKQNNNNYYYYFKVSNFHSDNIFPNI